MPPWNINAFAHEAGLAALRDAGHMHRSRCAMRQAKKILMEDLHRLPGIEPLPSEANFILCRLDEPGSAELCELLAAQGILVRDCRSFSGLDDRYVRVAVRSGRDNYQLVSALRKALA
jgi:threonine-phosphate decarboxylase